MISKNHTHSAKQAASVRQTASVCLAALILAALTLCALMAVRPARAAEWMQPYLQQVKEWGVMRGDGNGNLNEDRTITRAEFVTLVNRAFGYTEVGNNPFTDVNPNDWFAEDISIAHQAGYFNGTSPNTASPLSPVTREQAAVLLGRCLRLQGTPGVSATTFNDVESIGGWSRGMIQEAADLGIIQGYTDGTFRPDVPITRGQMACFLVRALGTLIQEPGEQSSGGVYGNLTITVPGVKLKDTTITGNLYLTGGVGLGDLELENVTVLGKIVISGSGEAEHGKNSITLRNVTAGGLEVDSLMDQFLSIRAEGLTSIDNTVVRTSAYLEDLTDDGLGLKLIKLDGADGVRLQLAGNIKEVLNLTPNSILHLAQGVAGVVTMDEKAAGASLTIDVDSVIKQLNLDAATPVTGAGSITRLNVNAAGSNVSMLPDTVYVRPGITGTVANQNMDNKAANESSEEPRILAGYPAARNIAPTSADAVFRTNKTGTIRWALTALMDGSLGEADLINPASNARIILSGTINATASNTDFTARLTGLTKEGSYYISALMEDARGHRSAVKVAAFTTPDDTAPAFAAGYPENPILTTDPYDEDEQVAQIMVMANKTCQLYYVLLPKGSTAPTAADFRAAAIPGSLGFGVVTLYKNTPFLVSRINSSHLAEKTEYDLYLWLNDADNGKSSAVIKKTVLTKDITPPNILRLDQRGAAARTVTMGFALDEPGMLSWAVVKTDRAFFRSGIDLKNPGVEGHIQIENAVVTGNVVQKGGPVRAANADTDYTFTITGLEEQTSYDLYYSFKDTEGNYGVYNEKIALPFPIKTQDGAPPTVSVDFSKFDTNANGVKLPWADSDLRLEFSEIVMGGKGEVEEDDFLKLYQAVQSAPNSTEKAKAKEQLAAALRKYIELYSGASTNGTKVADKADLSDEQLKNALEWIDYREAIVTQADQKTTITFPGANVGVKLQSGRTYYFRLSGLQDTSGNLMTPDPTTAPTGGFTTAYATVNLATADTVRINKDDLRDSSQFPNDRNGTDDSFRVNWSFTMLPNATGQAADNIGWDMLIWSDTKIEFELFSRSRSRNGGGWTPWQQEGTAGTTGGTAKIDKSGNDPMQYVSLTKSGSLNGQEDYPKLNQLNQNMEYEYAIHLVSANDNTNPSAWISRINMRITIMAGGTSSMNASSLTFQGTEASLANGIAAGAMAINLPDPFTYTITPEELDGPEINTGWPIISNGSTSAQISLALDRVGSAYFMAVPLKPNNGTDTTITSGNQYSAPVPITLADGSGLPEIQLVPKDGMDNRTGLYDNPMLSLPAASTVATPPSQTDVIWGSREYPQAGFSEDLTLQGLKPNTTYLLLIATKGVSRYSDRVYCYTFSTSQVAAPRLELDGSGSIVRARTLEPGKGVGILLVDGSVSDLYEPFDSSVATTNYYETQRGKILTNGTYTILDALIDDYGSRNNQTNPVLTSVFDEYAKQETKDAIQAIIESRIVQSSSIVQRIQSYETPGSAAWSIISDSLQVTSGTYVFLAYAESTLGSDPSFRAFRPLEPEDKQWPTVDPGRGVVVTITPREPGNPLAGYKGEVTITFSENIYFRDMSSGAQNQVGITPTRMSDETFRGIWQSAEPICHATGGWEVKLDKDSNGNSSTSHHYTNTISYTIGRLSVNPTGTDFTFTIDQGLCDEQGNSPNNFRTAFQVTITIQGNDTDGYTVTRKSVTDAWDSTNPASRA